MAGNLPKNAPNRVRSDACRHGHVGVPAARGRRARRPRRRAGPALAAAGHEVVVFTLPHPGAADDSTAGAVRVLSGPDRAAVAPRRPPRRQDGVGQPHARAARCPARRLEARRRARPRLAGGLGGRHAARRSGTCRSSPPSTPPRRAATAARACRRVSPRASTPSSGGSPTRPAGSSCCTKFMVDEVSHGFDLPADKVDMIPNGVDPDRFAPPPDAPPGAGPTDPSCSAGVDCSTRRASTRWWRRWRPSAGRCPTSAASSPARAATPTS